MFLNRCYSCFCVGGVFERRMDVALWSSRAAAGEGNSEQIHSDSIQSKVSTPKGVKVAMICMDSNGC